jgi:N-acyl-D-amino-acid deacylase
LERLEEARPATNVVTLVGHGNLRLLSIGMENRAPIEAELSEMRKLLSEALEDGAYGLSTGLIYAPCIYAETEELTELCKIVQKNDGVFVVHMRNEGDYLLESIAEVMQISNLSGVRLHISHFKASGEANWGKSREALTLLDKFREKGIDVSFDQYPYPAGSTFLSSLLPEWIFEGGIEKMLSRLKSVPERKRLIEELTSLERTPDWEKLLITSVKHSGNKHLEGMSVKEISKKLMKEPAEAVLDLIYEEDNAVTMVLFTQSEEDVRQIMAHPLQTVCTDGIVLGKPHPRAYGSFPRVLGKYVNEGVIHIEEAIRKMTSWPATRFRLSKRGVLRTGFKADITVFDPATIRDTATFKHPINYPVGIEYVVVNGKLTVNKGEYTGTRNGKVLRQT